MNIAATACRAVRGAPWGNQGRRRGYLFRPFRTRAVGWLRSFVRGATKHGQPAAHLPGAVL